MMQVFTLVKNQPISIISTIFQRMKSIRLSIILFFNMGPQSITRDMKIFLKKLIRYFGNDIAISCMDSIGHGRSGGSRAFVKNFSTYTTDFSHFLNLCHDKFHDQREFILCGHSLGGLIILSVLIESLQKINLEISKCILVNPCIEPWIKIPSFAKPWLMEVSNKFAKIRMPSVFDGFDQTHDYELASEINNDHLYNHFMTIKMGYEIVKQSHHIAGMPYYLEHPTLFLTSGEDRIVNVEVTKLFMHGVAKDLVTHYHYKDAFHDLLNETCKDEVFNKIIKYIEN
jgi:acylglycerol lipase